MRVSDEYQTSGSDSSRSRALLRGLTGKDDKRYQIRLQDECMLILTEERTWHAVEHLATMLLERGSITGPEIEAVFAELQVPRTSIHSGIHGSTREVVPLA